VIGNDVMRVPMSSVFAPGEEEETWVGLSSEASLLWLIHGGYMGRVTPF
jgi:hypothetical protein